MLNILKIFKKKETIKRDFIENDILVKKFNKNIDFSQENILVVEPWYAIVIINNWIIDTIQTEPWSWNIKFEKWSNVSIYFIKTTEILNQKRWTKNPIKYLDKKNKILIELRCFWNYSYRISDIEKFWLNYVWTKENLKINEIREILIGKILELITDTIAEMELSFDEIDKNRIEISNNIKNKLNIDIQWIEITDFKIEDINFTENTLENIKKILNIN